MKFGILGTRAFRIFDKALHGKLKKYGVQIVVGDQSDHFVAFLRYYNKSVGRCFQEF